MSTGMIALGFRPYALGRGDILKGRFQKQLEWQGSDFQAPC